MTVKTFKDQRKAWDGETMGYGKHDYLHVDPDAINIEDFAQRFDGEQLHRGDVREESTAYNKQSPENSITLDLLSKIGTVFMTYAEGLEGMWMVTGMPVVRSPEVFCRASKCGESNGEYHILDASSSELSCTDLGCAVGTGNTFKQVAGEILAKGKHQNLG